LESKPSSDEVALRRSRLGAAGQRRGGRRSPALDDRRQGWQARRRASAKGRSISSPLLLLLLLLLQLQLLVELARAAGLASSATRLLYAGRDGPKACQVGARRQVCRASG
jgi:hypothetical protein